MGTFDIDRAAHNSAVHKLYHADTQDPGSTRDCIVHFRRYVEHCPRPTWKSSVLEPH